VAAVREAAVSQRTRVRVALPSGFIAFFADDLARLGRAHPELTLEIVSGGRLHDLPHGEADLAVRSGPILDEALVARTLGDVGFSLYAAPRYLESAPRPATASSAPRGGMSKVAEPHLLVSHRAPMDPHDLAGHQVIAYGADLASLPAAQWLQTHATQSTIVLRTNEIATMLEAAASGAGIALLPCMVADIEPRLVRLTPQVLAHRELSLVYRREVRMNDWVRVTAEFLVEAMRSRAGQISGSSNFGLLQAP
jgi:DNA-binding transcriptional LysR family regulator